VQADGNVDPAQDPHGELVNKVTTGRGKKTIVQGVDNGFVIECIDYSRVFARNRRCLEDVSV
jgi:hypothetical protein